MVERHRRAAIARLYVAEVFAPGANATIRGEAVHHIRVLRLTPGAPVALLDGVGHVSVGSLSRCDREVAVIEILETHTIARPPVVDMLVPVADRERMLWLAEKSAELQLTSWRPVQWNRSASVSHRGEGEAFSAKVSARMISAAAQSGNAWLPAVHPAMSLPAALAQQQSSGLRLLLDRGGGSLGAMTLHPLEVPVTVALGPEGGIEDEEHALLAAAGFVRVSLGETTLRFETAGVAALAAVRMAAAS
jgi:16S rRNA (uracil1498-N3)-methyltransferase